MRSLLGLAVLLLLAGCGLPPTVPDPCPAEMPDLPIDPSLVADAGPDFEAEPGDRIVFDGTGSMSLSGGEFTYTWGQVAGPCGKLDLDDPARPGVKVPPVEDGDITLVYRLHLVRDGKMSAGDEAEIVVTA